MVVNDEVLRALGSVVVSFQSAEVFIGEIGCRLISENDAVGRIALSNLSFRNLCEASLALFRHRCKDQQMVDQLEKLVTQALKLEQERNTFMHSSWGTSPEMGGTFRLKRKLDRKSGLRTVLARINVGEVQKVAKELEDLSSALASFLRQAIGKQVFA
jgi:hypothetical protein